MKATPLKLCIVTGSRAEYGLLLPLMQLINKNKRIQLQLIVTGMHLSPEFGLTYKQIADQLEISIDTIRTYLRRIYEKLHVQSRTEAVAKYLRQ